MIIVKNRCLSGSANYEQWSKPGWFKSIKSTQVEEIPHRGGLLHALHNRNDRIGVALHSAGGAAGMMGGPAAILSWVIAGLFFIFMVFPFAELGGLFPFSGSLARYNHYSHGTLSNYLLAWTYTLGAITTLSSEAIAIVEYASDYVPQFWNSSLGVLTPPLGILVAAGLIVLFFFVQVIGGERVRLVQQSDNCVEVHNAHPNHNAANGPIHALELRGRQAARGLRAVRLRRHIHRHDNDRRGVCYEGFRQGLEYAGEGRNPQRDVPMGTILAVVVTIAIYVLLQVTFLGAVNWSKAGVSPPAIGKRWPAGIGRHTHSSARPWRWECPC